jgi:hypothetical protein
MPDPKIEHSVKTKNIPALFLLQSNIHCCADDAQEQSRGLGGVGEKIQQKTGFDHIYRWQHQVREHYSQDQQPKPDQDDQEGVYATHWNNQQDT